ncbi:hypothetical protein Ahu01nite_034170 [Winogradskya humida]|uniref:Uncharacterized protein n=1 Tax=Winogradskya humida TaxID=113566 RepID=A0ABQ3ZNZ4_9ACTN|nr:hypothetical protein Ahu01nite_034170 [Actinoplanes humidus]
MSCPTPRLCNGLSSYPTPRLCNGLSWRAAPHLSNRSGRATNRGGRATNRTNGSRGHRWSKHWRALLTGEQRKSRFS